MVSFMYEYFKYIILSQLQLLRLAFLKKKKCGINFQFIKWQGAIVNRKQPIQKSAQLVNQLQNEIKFLENLTKHFYRWPWLSYNENLLNIRKIINTTTLIHYNFQHAKNFSYFASKHKNFLRFELSLNIINSKPSSDRSDNLIIVTFNNMNLSLDNFIYLLDPFLSKYSIQFHKMSQFQ